MKSLINSRVRCMFLTLIALTSTASYAAVEDFELSVRNVKQTTSNTLEFDVYLLDTDNTETFEFAGCQLGFLLNSSIYNGGVLTITIDNTSSGFDSDQQYVYTPDVVSSLAGYSGLTLIRLAANSEPPFPPGAGSGTVITTTGNGTLLTHFIMTSSVDFTPNSTADIEFCSSLAVSPLFPTVVNEYIDGDSTPLTVTPGTNANVYGNPVLNETIPSAFNVTGTGSYCEGGVGLPVGLDGSEADVTYTLYLGAAVIATETGTGTAISFGNQTQGIYTVTGTNVAGDRQMTGQAEITAVVNTASAGSSMPTLCINTPLTAITHTTSGATGIGAPVSLPAGVSANWLANTITISGTPTAAGVFNYSIPLTGGCGSVNATGTITVNPLPGAAGAITGTAAVCQGATGVTYSVPAITNATSYTWAYSGTGATIIGSTNSITINFAANAASGNLTVYGVNTCGNGTISANYPITVNPIPAAAGAITGTAAVCQGATGVTYSVPAITNATSYTWAYSGTGATIIGSTNSITINFAANAASGNLTVYGVNTCGNGTISANYPITVNPIPAAAGAITGTAAVCQGATGVTYSVPAITNATSYTWAYSGTGATIIGSTNSITINFAANAASGNLTVYGVNTCGNGTISANYPITINANVTPTFTQLGPYCVGATPGTLPTTSLNGITGTWSPTTISTVSAGSTVYTFTPSVGQCGTTTTMTVVVNVIPIITGTTPGSRCGTGSSSTGSYC